MVKVSVIMVTRNGADFIRESIQSILDQTFKDFELLIVYQPSEDNTLEIIESFEDKRIRVIRHSSDYPRVFNVGLNRAMGKYIAIHDDDDVSLPGRLKKEVRYLDRNEHIQIVCSTTIEIDKYGNKLHLNPRGIYKRDGKLTPLEHLWCVEYFIPHSSVMFRKTDGRYDNIKKGSDMKFFLEMIIEHDTIYQFPNPLVHIRRGIKSHTSDFSYDEQLSYRKRIRKDIKKKYGLSFIFYMKGRSADHCWAALMYYHENKRKSMKHAIISLLYNPTNKYMWKRIIGRSRTT